MTAPAHKLRVLWLIKGLGPGGAERLLVEHAERGDHQRFDYEAAYVVDWKDRLVPELVERGVPAHCLGVRSQSDPRWALHLSTLLRRERFDVVHAHSPLVASVARGVVRTLPRSHRPAFVYTEHNRWPSYKTGTRLANQLTYSWNDTVFAVSDDVKGSVPARWRDRVEVVIHGVNVEQVQAQRDGRDAMRKELGVDDDTVLAVTVANLRPGKNYPGLLEAARRVVDSHAPVQFVAAGQGQLQDEVDALHAQSGLGDRFRLLGYRDDTTRLIAAADLFVLASHHEGLPVTVMESLTLGVPVIAPRVGGLPEVVESERNGILVPPGSPTALAEAIERAADPAIRAALADGARATGDRFDSAAAFAHIDATYASLTSRS